MSPVIGGEHIGGFFGGRLVQERVLGDCSDPIRQTLLVGQGNYRLLVDICSKRQDSNFSSHNEVVNQLNGQNSRKIKN